jgi:hypothetical protein
MSLRDSGGGVLTSGYETNGGTDLVLSAEISQAGTHYVRIGAFANDPEPFGVGTGANAPPHFTMPYTLTVSQ